MEQRVHLSHELTRARVGFNEQLRRPKPGQNHSSIAGGSFLLPLDKEDSLCLDHFIQWGIARIAPRGAAPITSI